MIHRWITKEITELLSHFPVVGIIGPRQVGKTTLAKQLKSSNEILYLDLEFPPDIAKLENAILFFENNLDKCIILDEVQRKPELFPLLRALVDRKRTPGRFILLGSASPDLIRDGSESLAGRIAYTELATFNLIEVGFNYKDLWLKGGFPDAFLAPSEELRSAWHNNFIKTYIERDLPLLGLKASPIILNNFITMIAHTHGNLWNSTNVGKSLELSSPTIKHYLDFLSNAFLLTILKPYSKNIKKSIVKSPKVYIRDTGILHYLLRINDFNVLHGHPVLGFSWEGFVIEQVKQLCMDEYDLFFYRTHKGAECDLVLTTAGIPKISVEIKYTSSPKISKGFLNSIKDLGTPTNYIVTPQSDNYKIAENVEVINFETFIKRHFNDRIKNLGNILYK